MRQIDIVVNQRSYTLACDDGQEDHVSQLAAEMDMRAAQVVEQIPQASESMVLVMTALMLADELYESQQESGRLYEQISNMHRLASSGSKNSDQNDEAEGKLARAIEEIAAGVENMVASIESNKTKSETA